MVMHLMFAQQEKKSSSTPTKVTQLTLLRELTTEKHKFFQRNNCSVVREKKKTNVQKHRSGMVGMTIIWDNNIINNQHNRR